MTVLAFLAVLQITDPSHVRLKVIAANAQLDIAQNGR